MVEVIFTERARKQLKLIFAYVFDEFGSAALIRLESSLFHKLKIISQSPASFPFYSKSRNIRKVVVNSKTLLFYRVEDGKAQVTAVKSSYQNYSPEDVS